MSRQDQHISGWLAKKKAREANGAGGNSRAMRGGRGMGMGGGTGNPLRSVTVGKGASAGRKYGSKPMQQFHEMRGQMDKRKGKHERVSIAFFLSFLFFFFSFFL